ncbi:uncharacterized protein LOC123684422 [Harmonia axyridis]|uniref:uncharacterized protein LOC123684422 n=1 Tax=Harmonia axyridis TaxID=115357 RepID=UPI001E27569E|nr:uncharacterized protein LOC123684422 [Harmonia axyridis]
MFLSKFCLNKSRSFYTLHFKCAVQIRSSLDREVPEYSRFYKENIDLLFIVLSNSSEIKMRNILLIICFVFISCTYSLPSYNRGGVPERSDQVRLGLSNTARREKFDRKTAVSWGASGMPFSVLYMRRRHSPKKIQTTTLKPIKQERRRSNSKKTRFNWRIPYSVIPRVFSQIWRMKVRK